MNLDKLKRTPAFVNMPVDELELRSTRITPQTYESAEIFFRQQAKLNPRMRIISVSGEVLSLEEAALEVQRKSDKGQELVKQYKKLLNYMKKRAK